MEKFLIHILASLIPFSEERKHFRNRMKNKLGLIKKEETLQQEEICTSSKILINENNIKNGVCPQENAVSDENILKYIEYINNNYREILITLLDVGARNGLDASLIFPLFKHINNKNVYGIEPDIEEAERLQNDKNYNKIFTNAISDNRGKQTLYLTKTPGCSSILEPNMQELEEYNLMISEWFRPQKTIEVDTVLLDDITKDINYDYLKIDIQGLEYNILKTIDYKMHNDLLAIVTEAQTIQFYKKQYLLGDLLNLMHKNDFLTLSAYHHSANMDGLDLEYDFVFIKNPKYINTKEKLIKHLLIAFLTRKSIYICYLLRTFGYKYLSKEEIIDIYKIIDEPVYPNNFRIKPIENI